MDPSATDAQAIATPNRGFAVRPKGQSLHHDPSSRDQAAVLHAATHPNSHLVRPITLLGLASFLVHLRKTANPRPLDRPGHLGYVRSWGRRQRYSPCLRRQRTNWLQGEAHRTPFPIKIVLPSSWEAAVIASPSVRRGATCTVPLYSYHARPSKTS
ncbi:hypothetical protein IF1G_08067 [Cordyceps javanica]|uniref:Uncharacterized protein n=1 Tax=Cordyceps javanica TaxID=43265 RepID=A0A545UVK1_9HYPO|nr:hypothetical protein IF1G_08067 [Cordyceps javanica]